MDYGETGSPHESRVRLHHDDGARERMPMGSGEEHIAPSWQSDPFGRHEQRWWDGDRWSEKVRSSGRTGIDPPGIVAKPEHARDNVPASPISDAADPVLYRSRNVPRVLLLAALVLLTIIVLVVVGILTA